MFKIGEFSTIARVSDVLLRHYDELDLFKPHYVDPDNGYRYYVMDQLPLLNRILALRDLGLSLDQIGRLVQDNISPDEIQGMLKLKQAQIEQEIAAEQARLRRVASRLKQVQQHGTAVQPEVVMKTFPEQHFLSIREPMPYIRQSGWLYYQITDAIREHQVAGLSYCMAIFHDSTFREKNTDFELGFLLNEPHQVSVPLPQDRQLTVKTLPPVEKALTCVHAGPWAEIHLGFGAIGQWMETQNLKISGKPRELYFNLVPPEQDERLIVEIQIPVREKSKVEK